MNIMYQADFLMKADQMTNKQSLFVMPNILLKETHFFSFFFFTEAAASHYYIDSEKN